MHNYTREDILRLVEEEDVAFIRLQFTDIFGTMKNMAVTVSQLEKALDNRCMFDVSSLDGLSERKTQICIFIRIWVRLKFSPGVRSREKWRV